MSFLVRNFNPRSRVGNDDKLRAFPFFPLFQSTFPRGERRVSDAQMAAITDFNPRSRVGNDNNTSHIPVHLLISIHVPAWGTTDVIRVGLDFNEFQSTFPRGERLTCRKPVLLRIHFNPRSRVGNDAFYGILVYLVPISIHVPAWGTTNVYWKESHTKYISIHVPAWGTTRNNFKGWDADKFQSTFPRGERPSSAWTS